ncbi:alpha/beta fold hydrolase [Cupriavidus necator]|uniref:alpha/beta fold hydrolase n=1 Tax=Cupriavidus necator TaxID=106590 RepID=UPI0039C3DE04
MTQGALHVMTEGRPDGLPVVLLHAICTSSDLWQPQLPLWNRRYRTIRVDLPGHGRSQPLGGEPTLSNYAVALAETLDASGHDRVALLGTSFGAMVAQAFALRFPERVHGLVLAHAGALTSAEVAAIWDQRLRDLYMLGVEQHVRSTIGRWLTPGFAHASPLTVDWLGAMVRATSRIGYREAVGAIQGLDHKSRLGQIAVPTLVIAGAADMAVPPEIVRPVANGIPNAEYAVLDAAHMGNVEQPVAFAEVVGRFLNALGSGAAER